MGAGAGLCWPSRKVGIYPRSYLYIDKSIKYLPSWHLMFFATKVFVNADYKSQESLGGDV